MFTQWALALLVQKLAEKSNLLRSVPVPLRSKEKGCQTKFLDSELVDGGAVARRRRMSREGALAMITGQVRRRLSLTAARANARLILDRVQFSTRLICFGSTFPPKI